MNYIEDLQAIFDERRLRNKNYSLRALARDLGVDPSDLVNILNNKKRVTPRVAYRIGLLLDLKEAQLLDYILPTLK
jgi:plasmid maintenance system antidote protein VapI